MKIRQARDKIRKFIQVHPISAGIVAAEIDNLLHKGLGVFRSISGSPSGKSTSAPTPPAASAPIPPSASAPIPPAPSARASILPERLISPISEPARTYFYRLNLFYHPIGMQLAAVQAARNGVARIILEREQQYFLPIFHVQLIHSGDFETTYTGYGNVIIHQGNHIQSGQQIATLGFGGSLLFQMKFKGKLVDPQSYLYNISDQASSYVVSFPGVGDFELMMFAFEILSNGNLPHR